jgi:hypothetical protein
VRSSLHKGDEVSPGQVVGSVQDASEAEGTHCAGACLHWGLLSGEDYLDPLSLLPPWLLGRPPSRLLPVTGVPLPEEGAAHGTEDPPGPTERPSGTEPPSGPADSGPTGSGPAEENPGPTTEPAGPAGRPVSPVRPAGPSRPPLP